MNYQNLLEVKGDLVVRENSMQKEVEIKARISSIPRVRKKLQKIGAQKLSKKRIVDIYYTPKKGEKYYGKGSRLKFRIRYDGKSNKGRLEVHKISGLLESIEYELPINDVGLMKKMLKELKYKQCALVDKVREYYKFGKLGIVIDKEKTLGNFMEIEMMNTGRKKALVNIKKFYKKIGISKNDFLIGDTYVEMMMKYNNKKK